MREPVRSVCAWHGVPVWHGLNGLNFFFACGTSCGSPSRANANATMVRHCECQYEDNVYVDVSRCRCRCLVMRLQYRYYSSGMVHVYHAMAWNIGIPVVFNTIVGAWCLRATMSCQSMLYDYACNTTCLLAASRSFPSKDLQRRNIVFSFQGSKHKVQSEYFMIFIVKLSRGYF